MNFFQRLFESKHSRVQRLAKEADDRRLAQEAAAKTLAEEAEVRRLAEEVEAKRTAEEAEARRLDEQLIDAVRNRDIDQVKIALESGADVNTRDVRNETPLHKAALHHLGDRDDREHTKRMLDIIELLISRGADLNALDQNKETPLGTAVGSRFVGGAALLLKAGADSRMKGLTGTVLDHVMYQGGAKSSIWGQIFIDLLQDTDPQNIDVEACLERAEQISQEWDRKHKERGWRDWNELSHITESKFEGLVAEIETMKHEDLVLLLGQIAKSASGNPLGHLNTYERRRTVARAIGEKLFQQGGLQAMKRALDNNVGTIPGQRTIDQFWDGIGGWQG